MRPRDPVLIAVTGPTASGKTPVAESIAASLDAQLVNADAFQIYRGMDIGTAKPADKSRYALLDLKDPDQEFGVGAWLRLAEAEIEAAHQGGRSVVLVGGTGLYIRALMEEFADLAGRPDPELRSRLNETPIDELRQRLVQERPEIAARTDLANPVRVRRALERLQAEPMPAVRIPAMRKLKLALLPSPEDLEARIGQRTEQMVQNGWIQEIESLREQGYRREHPGFRAIGYRALWDHVHHKIGLIDAIAATNAETRRYAKRQRTWLRQEPSLVELSATTEDDTVRKAMDRVDTFLM